jgi:hypothetical protein
MAPVAAKIIAITFPDHRTAIRALLDPYRTTPRDYWYGARKREITVMAPLPSRKLGPDRHDRMTFSLFADGFKQGFRNAST